MQVLYKRRKSSFPSALKSSVGDLSIIEIEWWTGLEMTQCTSPIKLGEETLYLRDDTLCTSQTASNSWTQFLISFSNLKPITLSRLKTFQVPQLRNPVKFILPKWHVTCSSRKNEPIYFTNHDFFTWILFTDRMSAALSIYLLPCWQEFQTLGFYLHVVRYQNFHHKRERKWLNIIGLKRSWEPFYFMKTWKVIKKCWDATALAHSFK